MIRTLPLILLLALSAQAGTRSPAAVREFRKQHACPATASVRGACPGFQVDHIVPLCAGGEDAAANMQWLTVEAHKLKTRGDVRQCMVARKAGV